MSQKASFPNHSGGVIQVAHAGRWGAVPEAMLEDARLSLDARAVAAWLAIKASGWQINISALRRAVGKDDKPLGKDKWLRIARELEDAGYFARQCGKGADGQWNWRITFSAVGGKPDHGSPATRKPATKTNKAKPSPLIPSPLPPRDSSTHDNLIYPLRVSDVERDAVAQLLTTCPKESHQPLLDELAGAIEHRKIRNGITPYARALVRAVAEGRFSPSLGVAVAASRQAAKNAANLPSAPFVADAAAQAAGERLLARVRGLTAPHVTES